MTTLVFTASHDTRGKRDATGAFIPEAKRFRDLHGGRLVFVDNRKGEPERAEQVLAEISRNGAQPWRTVAFFCHGTPRTIQLGFNRATVRELARYIARTSERDVRVLLYCCSTASALREVIGGESTGGDGGFADMLRDALCAEGATKCRVMGHVTVGHTSKNPHVRLFEGGGSPIGGQGGAYVVRPGSKLWTPWREALAGEFMGGSDFRLRFWQWDIGEIHEALATGRLQDKRPTVAA